MARVGGDDVLFIISGAAFLKYYHGIYDDH